jgi:hypothetical protein
MSRKKSSASSGLVIVVQIPLGKKTGDQLVAAAPGGWAADPSRASLRMESRALMGHSNSFVEIGTASAEGPPRDQHGKEVLTCSRIGPFEGLAWPAPSYPQVHRKKSCRARHLKKQVTGRPNSDGRIYFHEPPRTPLLG